MIAFEGKFSEYLMISKDCNELLDAKCDEKMGSIKFFKIGPLQYDESRTEKFWEISPVSFKKKKVRYVRKALEEDSKKIALEIYQDLPILFKILDKLVSHEKVDKIWAGLKEDNYSIELRITLWTATRYRMLEDATVWLRYYLMVHWKRYLKEKELIKTIDYRTIRYKRKKNQHHSYQDDLLYNEVIDYPQDRLKYSKFYDTGIKQLIYRDGILTLFENMNENTL
jgi:hypothetical protein